MTYVIAKDSHDKSTRCFVTHIREGGYRLDHVRHAKGHDPWQARKFKTLGAADKALALMAKVGGYDDYRIIQLEA
jgi:hypothetical protein